MVKYFMFILLSSGFLYSDQLILEKDVPLIPRMALLKISGKSHLDQIFLEKDESSYFYHAKWKNGTSYEATVTEDGTLAIFIEEIEKNAVPEKVRKSVDNLLSKASKTEFQKQTFLVYKVNATVDNKNYEALISPSGKIVGIKEVSPEAKNITEFSLPR